MDIQCIECKEGAKGARAFYSVNNGRIYVCVDAPGVREEGDLQATIAHELSHAHDVQEFDLSFRLKFCVRAASGSRSRPKDVRGGRLCRDKSLPGWRLRLQIVSEIVCLSMCPASDQGTLVQHTERLRAYLVNFYFYFKAQLPGKCTDRSG